ncbi:LytR/AlgR family response regulator transcription factor [Balneola sp. MJW-20]|uniref:LytR/AlgR family response regulator transcription factor n=1 Tax=Gracilimonas aurantiaca TaxID=3234185 RepID=UPI003466E8D7
MKCLIIDDEPAARDILRTYIDDAQELILAGSCANALEARSWLENNDADLLFVDINMPKLSGLSFIKTLSDPPLIILTTAYSEHALDGFELGVIDYLLKPFSFERFLQAVDKAGKQSRQKRSNESPSVTIKADGKLFRVLIKNILCAESKGDYITLHTSDKMITFYSTLTRFLEECPVEDLIRVHRSWLVNLNNIDYVEGNMIRIKEKSIPIGSSYKDEFMERYR